MGYALFCKKSAHLKKKGAFLRAHFPPIFFFFTPNFCLKGDFKKYIHFFLFFNILEMKDDFHFIWRAPIKRLFSIFFNAPIFLQMSVFQAPIFSPILSPTLLLNKPTFRRKNYMSHSLITPHYLMIGRRLLLE